MNLAGIAQGIGGKNRLSHPCHLLDNAAADLEGGALYRVPVHIPGNLKRQFARVGIGQHQETAFGTCDLDDNVHRAVENLIQLQTGIHGAADLEQTFQLSAFPFLFL